MSTNKVYGDAPNEVPLVELDTRWEYARTEDIMALMKTVESIKRRTVCSVRQRQPQM